jgi:hypothetical protein
MAIINLETPVNHVVVVVEYVIVILIASNVAMDFTKMVIIVDPVSVDAVFVQVLQIV